MHEMSIVMALIDQVEDEVQRSGCEGRVLRLELVIGRMSGVHVDSIRFAFEMLTPNTILADTEIDIEQPRASCVCQACDATTEIDELRIVCPKCGSSEVRIHGGQQLLLQSIELEDSSG